MINNIIDKIYGLDGIGLFFLVYCSLAFLFYFVISIRILKDGEDFDDIVSIIPTALLLWWVALMFKDTRAYILTGKR